MILNKCIFLFIIFFTSIYSQKLPNFSTKINSEYTSFVPFDTNISENIQNSSKNDIQIIRLNDNSTEIIEYPNGKIYIKKTNPKTTHDTIINLDDVINSSGNSNTDKKSNLNDLDSNSKRELPIFEWTPVICKGEYPHKRRGHTSVFVDNYIVIFGGCELDIRCFNDLYFFNVINNEWTIPNVKGNAPKERAGHSATLYGSKMYVFGGSATTGYLNDLHVFDIETMAWSQLSFSGDVPKARVNHKAVLDNNGRIVIFGGYTDDGYTNDVYFIDLLYKRWEKPILSGIKPTERESFSMNFIRNKIWIFGGYSLGSPQNDLVILDLENLSWIKTETLGSKPSPRQGHTGIKHGKELFIIGGCNYKAKECYKETYLLNTESLYWTKISDSLQQILTPKDGHSANIIGANIYIFAGCQLMNSCSNSMVVLNTNNKCPLNCSNNGICRNNICLCYKGFQENDCSIQIKCLNDCSLRGSCLSDGKCSCFPGFAGQTCELYIPCPGNCTSETNGQCMSNSKCQCLKGFSGEACEITEIVKNGCINNCSSHGICNDLLGTCICQSDYTGNNCENHIANNNNTFQLDNQTNMNISDINKSDHLNNNEHTLNQSVMNHTNEISENKNNNISINENKTSSVNSNNETNKLKENELKINNTNTKEFSQQNFTRKNKIMIDSKQNESIDINKTENSKENNNVVNENKQTENAKENKKSENENKQSEHKINETSDKQSKINQEKNRTLKSELFGLSAKPTQSIIATNNDKLSKKYSKLEDCPDYCNHNGICINQRCYCGQGYVGYSCEISRMSDLEEGQNLSNLFLFTTAIIGLGFIIGCLGLLYLGSKTKDAELRDIIQYEAE